MFKHDLDKTISSILAVMLIPYYVNITFLFKLNYNSKKNCKSLL